MSLLAVVSSPGRIMEGNKMATIYEVMQHHVTHRIDEKGGATMLHPLGGAYALRYHHTDVVTAYPDGKVVLNSGGYRTLTTKERINRYMPEGCKLINKRGKWVVSMPNGQEVDFYDGMSLGPGWSALKPTDLELLQVNYDAIPLN